MEKTKKQYLKPEMTVMEVKLEPILAGSGGYPTGGNGYGDWYD